MISYDVLMICKHFGAICGSSEDNQRCGSKIDLGALGELPINNFGIIPLSQMPPINKLHRETSKIISTAKPIQENRKKSMGENIGIIIAIFKSFTWTII